MLGSQKPRGVLDWIARIVLLSALGLWLVLLVLTAPGGGGLWWLWLLLPVGLFVLLWLWPRSGSVLRPVLELVVALALWAVVFCPGLLRARDHHPSPQRLCLTSVKQLTLGMLVYAADYDGHLPPAPNWPLLTYPYVRNRGLYICPADDRPVKQSSGGLSTSYTLNSACGGLQIEDWPGAATLPMLFEGTALQGGPGVAAFRHHDMATVGFADGHAATLDRAAFARLPFSPREAEAAEQGQR